MKSTSRDLGRAPANSVKSSMTEKRTQACRSQDQKLILFSIERDTITSSRNRKDLQCQEELKMTPKVFEEAECGSAVLPPREGSGR